MLERPEESGFFKKRLPRRSLHDTAQCRFWCPAFSESKGLFISQGRAEEWRVWAGGRELQLPVSDSVLRQPQPDWKGNQTVSHGSFPFSSCSARKKKGNKSQLSLKGTWKETKKQRSNAKTSQEERVCVSMAQRCMLTTGRSWKRVKRVMRNRRKLRSNSN